MWHKSASSSVYKLGPHLPPLGPTTEAGQDSSPHQGSSPVGCTAAMTTPSSLLFGQWDVYTMDRQGCRVPSMCSFKPL